MRCQQSSKRQVAALLTLLALAACCGGKGDNSLAVDAQVDPPIDAAVPSPDANPACYLKSPGTALEEKSVTVAWDVLLKPDDQADLQNEIIGAVAGPAASYVLTTGGLIRVNPDGEAIQVYSFPDQAFYPRSASASPLGVAVVFAEFSGEGHFCFTAWDSEFQIDDCVSLGLLKHQSAPQWIGDHFSLAVLRRAALEVHTFSGNGVALASKKIADLELDTVRAIHYYAEEAAGYRIAVTADWNESGCGKGEWILEISPEGDVAKTPIAPNYAVSYLYSADSNGQESIMAGWIRCIVDGCTGLPDEGRGAVVFVSGSKAPSVKVVDLPALTRPTPVWDGNRFVLLASDLKIRLFTLDSTGEALAKATMPAPYDGPDAELAGDTIIALGPNDYLVAYALSTSSGQIYRAARVSIDE